VGRNQERKKNRNRRKELTSTAIPTNPLYDVSIPIPSTLSSASTLCCSPAALTLTVLAHEAVEEELAFWAELGWTSNRQSCGVE